MAAEDGARLFSWRLHEDAPAPFERRVDRRQERQQLRPEPLRGVVVQHVDDVDDVRDGRGYDKRDDMGDSCPRKLPGVERVRTRADEEARVYFGQHRNQPCAEHFSLAVIN